MEPYLSYEQDLLKALQDRFAEWKAQAGFKAEFDDLEKFFFIKDMILSAKFVSPRINRMICSRIHDNLFNWVQRIHSWLVPSPYSLLDNSEAQLFDDNDKEVLHSIMNDFMFLITLNQEVGLSYDPKKEAEFVDLSLEFLRKHHPTLFKFIDLAHLFWKNANNKKD